VRPRASRGAPPVIALGSGVTLTAVLRLLHRSGIPAFAVSPDKDFSSHSRWHRVLPGSEHLGPSCLKDWLDQLDLDGAVLLPCADDWVAATAALPAEMARRFPSSVASLKIIETVVDKWKFARLLQQERLPHPDTRLLNSLEEMESLPESAFQQYILKPLSSVAFSQKYGVKGFMIHSREDARQAMQQVPFPIMLQEFIPGPPTAGYFVEGFIDRHGRTSALFARNRLRMYPLPLGNSTFMQSVTLDAVAGAVAPLQYLLESLTYRGVFSAEFKYDARDGFFKLLEINARPWWYIEVPAEAGIDICRMAYLDALGLDIKPALTYKAGHRFGYPFGDLRAWRELQRAEGLGFWSWLASWRGASVTPFAWNDPMPALAFGWQQLWEYFRHKRAPQSAPTEAKAQNTADLIQDQELAIRR
jgi:predicted ATP-grasp superfamily ATP-dependent carboligase